MNDNITNVTPDGEQPAPLTRVNEDAKKETIEKKDNGKTARNVAMGAAVIAAAGAGVAVAEAIQPGDAEDVVEDVVEVDPNEDPVQAAAEFFGHKGDDDKAAPGADGAAKPGSDGHGEGARVLNEPELRPDGDHKDDTTVEPDDNTDHGHDGAIHGAPEEVAVEPEPECDCTDEPDVPDYVDQPEMGQIDVEIDESMNYDDPGDIIG